MENNTTMIGGIGFDVETIESPRINIPVGVLTQITTVDIRRYF